MKDVLYSGDMAHRWYDETYSKEDDGTMEMVERVLSDRGCRSVLDVGCGTGRHALRLHEAGFSVTGIDASPDMIARARSKNPECEFECMDMRKISLGKAFDAAISIDSAFSYMKTNDDALAALGGIGACMRKGGTLLIHMMNVWPEMAEGSFKREWTLKEVGGNGEMVIDGVSEFDPTDLVMRETSAYHQVSGDKKMLLARDSEPVELRVFTPSQMDLLFRLTGFKPVGFYGDMGLRPLSADNCDWLIVLGERL